jgi:L-rhamnonate dehydratase
MSLNVQYAIEIAQKAVDEKIDITWWEEVRLAFPFLLAV